MPQPRPFRLVVYLVAVAGIAAAWWLGPWREVEPPAAPADAPRVAVPDVATGEGTRNMSDASGPVRKAPEPPAAKDAELLVRGRCLAAESREPLQASLRVFEDDGAAAPTAESESVAAGASRSDGAFELRLAFAGQKNLRLEATSRERAPMSGRREGAEANGSWDLGDILMTRTAGVRGEVVDATGAPVAEVYVQLLMIGAEPSPMTFSNSHAASSDARGQFAMAERVAAGEWYVAVDGTGALIAPRKVRMAEGGEQFVRVEVERPDPAKSITGRVVDRAGLPLAGVALSAYGEGARGRANSGPEGTFVLHRGPPHFDRGKAGVELSASAPRLEHVRPQEGQWVAWGQHDVVVVMQPLAASTVRAVDARGERVEAFDLLYGQLTGANKTWMDYAAARLKRVEGGVVLEGLRRGEHVLLLVPRDEALEVAGPERFVVGDGPPGEWIMRVPDRVALRVEVVDAAGTGVPGCDVDLLVGFGEAKPDVELPSQRLRGARSPALRGSRQVSIASGATDARGVASFSAPPGRFLLQARCKTHLPLAREVVVAASEPVVRIVLEAASVLRGRLVPVEALPGLGLGEQRLERRLAVVARTTVAGAPRQRARVIARGEVSADGTFTLGPLPTGVASLRLEGWLVCNEVHTGAVGHALGEIDAVGGSVIEREFAVGAFLPAVATGIVLLDGVPVADGQFFLRRLEPEPLVSVRVATGKDGRFRTLVAPGVIGPQLAIPSQPGPGHVILPLPDRWTLGAGETRELRIEGRTRRLRLVVRGNDGELLRNRRVRIEAANFQRPGALASDAEGVVEIDVAPPDEFTVHVSNEPGPELSSSLKVPAGEGAVSLEVKLGR